MSRSTVHLDLEDLLDIAAEAIDGEVQVRDYGLIEAAAARQATTAFGNEAYPDDFTKTGALLHSLVAGHPLVDGNTRLGWLGTVAFLDLNGCHWSHIPDDDAVSLVASIADGSIRDVDEIAAVLRRLWA